MARIAVSTSSFARHDESPLALLRPSRSGRRLVATEARELAASARGLIAGTEALNRETLTACRNLAVISRCGVGTDGIDLEATAELGIRVLRTTDAHVDPVAELTLAGVLDLLRHVGRADRGLRTGTWDKPMGRLLRGKTLGIIGLGRTGRRLVELVAPFGCEVQAVDVDEDPAFAAANGLTYGSLNAVLTNADVVTLHLDYSPAAHHMIAARELALMKDDAILVNTARGGLIDEQALAAALDGATKDSATKDGGRIGGAYLDVFEREPYSGPLAGLDNVLLTPHIGSYAVEGRIAMEIEAVTNLLSALGEAEG